MKKIQDLISKMTLEEKASLCSGLDFWTTKPIERLDIPSIMLTDGPHGLRKQAGASDHLGLNESVPATCFPTASAMAATWNRELIYEVGQALGEECRQEKVGVILGPAANIKRTPLCGRNFEYFSEDPYLSGEMAKSHINGVQSQGIGTSLKHYAVNNQEFRRMTINTIVDQRALHEIYLAGFEIAIKGAQPWTVMCAYNRVNGTYCCEHTYFLNDMLKNEWGHQGLVVTDWGAMNERVEALEAGLELEMPGVNNGNDTLIVEAVRSGALDITVLDHSVARILDLIFKIQETLDKDFSYDSEAHHELARRVAGEGCVLLKNKNKLLPLKKPQQVALLGAFAKHPRYQGAGSSYMNPTKLDTLYEEMVTIAGEGQVTYAPGYDLKNLQVDHALLQEAIETAKSADVVVIHVGLPDVFEVEGLDRTHLSLPESHNQLIEQVAASHDHVVVVLSNGSPVEMPWIDKVDAVLEGYLGGQAGAGGVADVLYGIVNPSGKLAETFPLKLSDTPSYLYYPGGPKTVAYRESLYIGYRFYDKVNKEVLFPFGHGLSYTSFAYEDFKLSHQEINDQETLQVQVTIRNTGDIPGKEVVQLYVSPVQPTAFRPVAELKGFNKVSLAPGEACQVHFSLDRRAFAYFSTELNDWQVESGDYRILVGASSRQIHLEGKVTVQSQQEVDIPLRDRLPAYVGFPADAKINQDDFETLVGHPVPPNTIIRGEIATINTPIADMQHSFVARRLHKMMEEQMQAMIEDEADSPHSLMMQAVMREAPLRLLLMMGGDQMNRGMINGLLLIINRRFFKGLATLLRARRK